MMKTFMGNDFLLQNETGRKLYHLYAEKMPVIDYHCHISPQDIADDTIFENLTQVWLYRDHYKWRAMRSCGVPEEYITGNASDYEKFRQWACIMPKLIGNPLYHWSHLELRRFFGITLDLNEQNCDKIWEDVNCQLKSLSVRKIIESSHVKFICTTDDPADSLEYHRAIQADESFHTRVVPAFRPDKALHPESPVFREYISKLSAVSGVDIRNFSLLCSALSLRIAFFNKMGCRASDHAMRYIPFVKLDEKTVDGIFRKALDGQRLSSDETDAYQTSLMLYLAECYHQNNWVMELHYGVGRNVNSKMYDRLGPDSGYDAIGSQDGTQGLVFFLDELEKSGILPKTLVFPISPSDNAVINTISGCFQSEEVPCKIQQGSAWWFNDTKGGMEDQLKSFADLSALGNFIGFLTDSRSFLSYTRHEYFRRILCNLIGVLVENGEYPCNMATLGQIVSDISYNNAVRYFGFKTERCEQADLSAELTLPGCPGIV